MSAQHLAVVPLDAPPDASVRLPGSKSITNRALACAALAEGTTTLRGALFADDTEAMMHAVASLGAHVETRPEEALIRVGGIGGPPEAGSRESGSPILVDARMSGTTGRFMAPVAALCEGEVIIDGHPQLRGRPFGDMAAALRSLGVSVDFPGGGDGLPMRVLGPICRRETRVSAERSSQFLSGLMLAAGAVPDGLSLHIDGATVSRPYVQMTAEVMRSFGVSVEVEPAVVHVAGGGYRAVEGFEVEPDASSASYFWAAAAVSGGSVRVEGLGAAAIQGDARFASLLESMGSSLHHTGDGTRVSGGPLRGIDVDLADMSDTAPTLAVVAALAQDPTTVRGIGFVRRKESDRIAAVVAELERCGVSAREFSDGFVIEPSPSLHGARIRTYDDHRIAMAFAVLGLVVPGVVIENPGCVSKTFPGFFDALDSLRR